MCCAPFACHIFVWSRCRTFIKPRDTAATVPVETPSSVRAPVRRGRSKDTPAFSATACLAFWALADQLHVSCPAFGSKRTGLEPQSARLLFFVLGAPGRVIGHRAGPDSCWSSDPCPVSGSGGPDLRRPPSGLVFPEALLHVFPCLCRRFASQTRRRPYRTARQSTTCPVSTMASHAACTSFEPSVSNPCGVTSWTQRAPTDQPMAPPVTVERSTPSLNFSSCRPRSLAWLGRTGLSSAREA